MALGRIVEVCKARLIPERTEQRSKRSKEPSEKRLQRVFNSLIAINGCTGRFSETEYRSARVTKKPLTIVCRRVTNTS